MSELWHGRSDRGPIEGCSDDCGARYDLAAVPSTSGR